jgi:signal transduction histidine kinase
MPWSKPQKIRYRIILPFTLLFAFAGVSYWLVSSFLVTRYLNNSLDSRMERVADIISDSSYVLNPNILEQLKKIADGEIVLFDEKGQVIRSTIKDSHALERLATIATSNQRADLTMIDMELDGSPCHALIKPFSLPEYGRSSIALLMQTNEIDMLSRSIIIVIGAIVLFGIAAMAGAGFMIAKTITAPVENLAASAARIAEGDYNERVKAATMDEIGVLAGTFNRMIDRIQLSEKNLVESEKLATAGRMAAGFAHEIRNPLTSIKMMGQILHGRLKDQPDKQEILGQFIKEIDRLDRIIQEMINKARPTELTKKPGQLNKQVEEVLMIAGGNLSAQNIETKLKLAEELPEIYMDTEKIKQVLWNLILNAKDAMPKGGKLEITTGRMDNNFVEIAVKDSGQGIQPENPDMLFRPFFTTKPEGVGLGLTMSLKIIEQHGGKLNLKNRTDGRGVEASFYLPVT